MCFCNGEKIKALSFILLSRGSVLIIRTEDQVPDTRVPFLAHHCDLGLYLNLPSRFFLQDFLNLWTLNLLIHLDSLILTTTSIIRICSKKMIMFLLMVKSKWLARVSQLVSGEGRNRSTGSSCQSLASASWHLVNLSLSSLHQRFEVLLHKEYISFYRNITIHLYRALKNLDPFQTSYLVRFL